MGTYVMEPVYFEGSVPPNVSSPFADVCDEGGLNEMERTSVEIFPCERRLSETVGTWGASETVFRVRSEGPYQGFRQYPEALRRGATPIDCFSITSPGVRETVSVSDKRSHERRIALSIDTDINLHSVPGEITRSIIDENAVSGVRARAGLSVFLSSANPCIRRAGVNKQRVRRRG